jgi:hypothetical protein
MSIFDDRADEFVGDERMRAAVTTLNPQGFRQPFHIVGLGE